ncbi:MAG: tetratricopeptide repeat protein [Verrucomicrobia bacterium]|nr:tetratricopeptide repeat protein [Verrucomicrobiota bacterium]
MTDENRDNLENQDSFLSSHEELLKTIKKEPATAEGQSERQEPTEAEPQPESPEPVAEEEPTAKEEPIPEPNPEPVVEIEPTIEVEPEPISKPEPIVEPEPTAALEPKIEKPAAQPHSPAQKTGSRKPAGKKKKKTSAQQHAIRDAEAKQRHEELLKQQALEQSEVKEVLLFLKKYAKPTGIAIAVVCALVLTDRFFKSQRYEKESAADTALMHARTAEDLQAILDDYASTPAGPIALMGLAREKFNAGQIDEAEALYTQFTKKHGDHELSVLAELTLIACKEAKGQLGDAHLLYGEFAKTHAGSYLAPSALMDKARCLETLGQLDEAQIAYEDIIVNFPESSWSQMAEANLKVVLGKKQ